jgi:hypothetical protein
MFDYKQPSVLDALNDLSVALACNYNEASDDVEIHLPAVTFDRFIYELNNKPYEQKRQMLAGTITQVTVNMPHGRLNIKKKEK